METGGMCSGDPRNTQLPVARSYEGSMPSWFPHIDSSVVLDGLKSLLWLVSLLIARGARSMDPEKCCPFDGSQAAMGRHRAEFHGVCLSARATRHMGARTGSLRRLPRGAGGRARLGHEGTDPLLERGRLAGWRQNLFGRGSDTDRWP